MKTSANGKDSGKFQLGFAASMFQSTLRFSNHQNVAVKMQNLSLTASWLASQQWVVRAGFGVITGGELQTEDGNNHSLQPGAQFMLGLNYNLWQNSNYLPRIDVSLFLSASLARSRMPSKNYIGSDLRLGTRLSWIVQKNFFPSLFVRIFGGPVQWNINNEQVVGSDIHHYQVGMGLGLRVKKIILFTEWAAIGEQNLSLGISLPI